MVAPLAAVKRPADLAWIRCRFAGLKTTINSSCRQTSGVWYPATMGWREASSVQGSRRKVAVKVSLLPCS